MRSTVPQSLSNLLADVLLFVETAEESPEARRALSGAGYSDAHHKAGHDLVELGLETAFDVAATVGTDTTLIHLIHLAATEVEMWQGAVGTKVAAALGEALPFVMGSDLHSGDHTLAVIARGKRALGMLQTHPGMREALGSQRKVEDQFQRGNVLVNRLVKLSDQQTDLEGKRVERPVLPGMCTKLGSWLQTSRDMANKAFGSLPELHGAVGHVPAGLGGDCGGASKGAVRHQRAIRQAPAGEVTQAPGWGVGRQGRNKENVGGGY
jgi:hypothetical protein